MGNYREIKRKLEQECKKLENANKQTKKIDNSSKDIVELLNNNEIANNIYRKVTIPDANKTEKNRKKNNDTRF